MLITHRGETMIVWDRVVTLEQGRIAGIGQDPAAGEATHPPAPARCR